MDLGDPHPKERSELWRPEPDRPLVLWLTIIIASYAALIAWGAQHRARRALTDSPRERA